MTKTIHLSVCLPNEYDATSHYRGHGPLCALRKTIMPELTLDFCKKYDAKQAMLSDAAFFQRPSTAEELTAIRIFKQLNVPVILDYDDMLLSVPTDNPAFNAYNNNNVKKVICDMIREADAVIVSTAELKRALQLPQNSLNDRVYVVRNALDDVHMVKGERAKPPEKTNRTALWRGSQSHFRDVMDFVPEIDLVAKAVPDCTFTFAGWNPWFLTDHLRQDQAICSGPLSIGEFMSFLHKVAPRVGYVPLHNSLFNRCKSNIAWLEMSWAGAVCLVPDWEEWRMPGAVTYRTRDDFKKALLTLIQMPPEKLSALNRMAWEHIEKHYLLTKVNHLRAEIIRAAAGLGPWPEGGLGSPEEEGMELE